VTGLKAENELPSAQAEQLLSFRLAGTEFACPVRQLREVVELVEVTRLEGGPGRVEGVVNYRGAIIPVLDARSCLGFPATERGPDAHIVIVEVGGRTAGLIVDDVIDVLVLPALAIEPPGPMVPLAGLLTGIAKHEDRLLFVLDLERLLADDRVGLPAPSAPTVELGPGLVDRWSAPTEGRRQPRDAAATAKRILRQRAIELSKPVAAPADRDRALSTMVRFALGDGAYAIRTDFAKEIVAPSRITPIPCAPACVLGAMNIRGTIVPVLSLGSLLELTAKAEPVQAEPRIIVIEVEHALFGLHVDRVLGMSEVEGRDVTPVLGAAETQPLACVEGELHHEGSVLCVVNPTAIPGILGSAEPRVRASAAHPAAEHG